MNNVFTFKIDVMKTHSNIKFDYTKLVSLNAHLICCAF